jgi:hypothetical protein
VHQCARDDPPGHLVALVRKRLEGELAVQQGGEGPLGGLPTPAHHGPAVLDALQCLLLEPTGLEVQHLRGGLHARQAGLQRGELLLPLGHHLDDRERLVVGGEQRVGELAELLLELLGLDDQAGRVPVHRLEPLAEPPTDLSQSPDHELLGEDVLLEPVDDDLIDQLTAVRETAQRLREGAEAPPR